MFGFGKKKSIDNHESARRALAREEQKIEDMEAALERIGSRLKSNEVKAARVAAGNGVFSRTVTSKMDAAAERSRKNDRYGCTGLLAEAGEHAHRECVEAIRRARKLREELGQCQ